MMQSEFLFLTTAVVRHVISGLCTLDALEINDMETSDVKSLKMDETVKFW